MAVLRYRTARGELMAGEYFSLRRAVRRSKLRMTRTTRLVISIRTVRHDLGTARSLWPEREQ